MEDFGAFESIIDSLPKKAPPPPPAVPTVSAPSPASPAVPFYKKPIFILLIILFLGLLGFGLYTWSKRNNASSDSDEN